MPSKLILSNKAYLYTAWNRDFVRYEGVLYESRDGENGQFKGKNRRFVCSRDPEIVFNSAVWLKKPDDNLARRLLTDYYLEMMDKLTIRIDNYEQQIKNLNEGVKSL